MFSLTVNIGWGAGIMTPHILDQVPLVSRSCYKFEEPWNTADLATIGL